MTRWCEKFKDFFLHRLDAQKIEMGAHARATSYDSLYRLQHADALRLHLRVHLAG